MTQQHAKIHHLFQLAKTAGTGMATVVETDVLVVAAASNWGTYGTCAALAYLAGNPDLADV